MLNEPLITKPFFSEKVWGNSELNKIFKTDIKETVGEVWLFSPVLGKETNLIGLKSGKNYGKPSEIFSEIDLLLKLISTSDKLSVQVHPDDKMAKILENQNNGKSEAWYFLENNGKIKVSNKNKDIIKSLDTEEWNESLEEVFLDKGDLIFVPAGTVHALCEGSTILEIQQSSDVTYRLYDWGRPREIHVEKAKKVLENIETSYVISRKCENFETKFFSVQTIKNLKRKGFGIYVNLKTYETIVLSENVEYFFEGEYIEFKK